MFCIIACRTDALGLARSTSLACGERVVGGGGGGGGGGGAGVTVGGVGDGAKDGDAYW